MSLLLRSNETSVEVSNKTKPKSQDQQVETEVLYRQKSILALSEKVIIGDAARNEDNDEFYEDNDDDEDDDEVIDFTKPINKVVLYKAILYSKHDSNIFKLSCNCIECFKCRETVILLFIEDFEYNILWERLQLLIKKFYDLVPDETESLMHKKYSELMAKNMTKWLSDGRIDTKKNIQISLGSNLPLSNEMTFILVFSMLYTRDPHQLFELLCIQVRSIVIAYSEGLKDIIKYDDKGMAEYNPSDLLNFIFEGYEKINNTAKMLSPLLFELQRGHLQQFSLTWGLLNKRMYQKYIFLEVQKIIPECILKLKQLVYSDRFKAVVYRFIQFDDEMTSTAQSWRDVWSLLHDYHKGAEDIARRKRISSGLSILRAVRDTDFIYKKNLNIQVDKPVFEWMSLDNREEIWHYVHVNLKTKWIACLNPRVTAPLENITCHKCKNSLATHNECSCRTCLIAGDLCSTNHVENTKQLYCTKCTFFEKLDRDYMDYKKKIVNKNSTSHEEKLYETFTDLSALAKISSGLKTNTKPKDIYHVSWALFKHLPDRVPYTLSVIEPDYFCIFQNNPCTNNACRVATNIIVLLYPLNFSKFLLHSYHPLNEEERKKLVTIHNFDFKNFIQKFCDDINQTTESNISSDKLHPLHFMDLLWESDDDSAVLSDMASAFAECYLIDFPPPQKHVLFTYILKLLRPNGKDIEIDMEWLEYVGNPKSLQCQSLILELPRKEGGKKRDERKIYEVQKKLEELNLKDEVLKKIENIAEISTLVNVEISALTDNDSDNESTTSISSSSTSSSPSKEELIETQIRKPLVEALKLAANNKKLEAELKSLQKEHSMLKDMVKDLEQIQDQNIHDKDHPETSTCKEHSFKNCHRQEGHGQCVCYYCTLFGQNGTECNSRIKETRERLRKRLHQIQSNKDTKSRNLKGAKISAELAKKIQSKQTARRSTTFEPKNYIPNRSTSPATTAKVNANPSTAKTKPASATPVQPPPPPPLQQQQQQQPATLKQEKPNVKPVIKAPLKIPLHSSNLKKNPIVQKNETIINTDQSTYSNKSLDDIIDYIEGSSSTGSAKKIAKKQKQKQKKSDKKKISSLEQLRQALDTLNERKKGIVKQLRILKSGKKKDITKINDIDNTLVMINSTASQLQNEMMKLVHSIRETNPDFDFPDINLTLDGISTNNDGNNKNTKVNNNGNINNNSNQQSRNEKIDSNDSNKNLDPNNSAFLKNMQKQFLPLFQKTVQSIAMQTKGGGSMGEAKRIVTIRRINTPHSEPQVTVTAKGLSPDKDQLLYTFINGQLVAATQENLKQQQQQQNMNQKPSVTLSKAKSANQNSAKSTANVNASTSCTQKTAAAASVPVSAATTAPTLSRRERKHLKKQQQLLQQQQKHMKTSDAQKATLSSSADSLVKENNKNETVSGNGKVIKMKEKNSNKENIVTNTNVKSSKRQQTPQPVEKCVEPPILVPAVSQKNAKVKNKKGKIVEPPPPPPVVPVAQVKEPKSNKKAANSVKEKPVPKPNAEELAKLNKKAEIKKVKNVQKRSAIDPEFDNNLFKLLNLEDSDSDDTEEDTSRLSESETPIVKCDLLKNNHINAIASTAAPTISNQPQINTTAKNKQNSKQKGKSVAAAPATNHVEKNTAQQQTQAQTQQQNKVLNTLKFEKVESKNKSKKKSIDNPLTKQEKKILLNADTTIEPIVKNKVLKQQQQQPVKQQSNPIISNHQQQLPQQTNVWNADQNYGVSIMEQLNRGIKVEGLSLPPGITLTRVDAEAAEKIRAQKESIRKLCQPMQTVVEPAKPQVIIANTPQMDNHYMANPMMQMGVAASPEGVIMVDTLKLNHSQNKPAVPEPSANVANQSKKSRRKNKNKKVDNIPTIEKINSLKEKSKNNAKNQNKNQTSINNNTCNNINNNQNSTPPNIVTLRNPMFHGLPDGIQYIHNKPPNSLPLNQPNRSNLGYDQPAAIIKNENGMFTIRNPALHQALASTSMNPEFSQSHNSPMKSESSGGYYNENIDVSGRTFNSAIGSELKNSAKQNAWNPDSNKSNLSQNTDIFSHLSHLNNQQTRCYSPFENNNNYGFNSDFLNAQSSHQPNNNSMPSNENYFSNLSNANGNNNGCYNVMNGFSAFGASGNVNNCSAPDGACDANHMGSLFGSIGSNNIQNKGCDDINYNQGTPGGISKFDDLLFLQNLQPGQRLNSEVTIHNISESKFLRNQEQNISNDIEITTIPATGVSSMSSGFNKPHQMQQQQQQQQHHHHHQQQQQQQHHHHQQSHQHHRIINDRTSNKKTESGGEYGESVFAPNQTVNLNELEMEEREIESFKRFNYYFEPPKNKPKININVKDIVVNKKYKVTSDSPSSSLFGELSSSISSNTHSCDDLLSHDMSGLNLQSNTNSDPMIYDTDNENTARTDHGVIGSKIKYFVDK